MVMTCTVQHYNNVVYHVTEMHETELSQSVKTMCVVNIGMQSSPELC